jgi:hypothetical protein
MNAKIILILLLFTFSLQSCAQTTSTNNTNPKISEITMSEESILKPVKKLIEAMETEDAVLIRKQFATTATQAYGADGKMKTPEATAKWLESDIISRQGKVNNPEYTVLSDTEVVVKGQYVSQGYSNKANFLFTVKDNLITSWRMRY